MKIAIVGAGISGMTCAHLLAKQHEVTLLEKRDRLGGHTATEHISHGQREYAIDTGFIVFNDRTYPLFNQLMRQIGVKAQPSEMSFSVTNSALDLQYNGHNLNTLFGQRKNLLNPWFYRFIRQILHFNNLAKQSTELPATVTVEEFLKKHQFTDDFSTNYLLPMSAAIWSASMSDIKDFSMRFLARFFTHHGLLDLKDRPQWYVIPGGSSCYIQPLLAHENIHIQTEAQITHINRSTQGVALNLADGHQWHGDEIIFACHSDQALSLLGEQASDDEQEILGGLRYQPNEVYLHHDESFLPSIQRVRASWNYQLTDDPQQELRPASVSYYMNRLQGIQCDLPFIVTLNPNHSVAKDKIIRRYRYDHPQFDRHTPFFQSRRDKINGLNHTWFCGAYWYNGFHEDGVRSANDVAHALGGQTLCP